jgi:site-specific recombinase XerD
MDTTATTELGHLRTLASSWELHLRAERKSPQTIYNYTSAVDRLAGYLEDRGMPTNVASITREHVEAFIVSLLDTRSPATAANRYKALQQYWKWLDSEGEITDSPMAKMSPPKLDEPEIPVVSLDDLRKLLATCKGNSFEDRRDTAIIRFLVDTGARLSEVAGLEESDLDLRTYEVAHVRGKGGKHRALPMGANTIKAMDGYLRKRASHKDARTPSLWLGAKGRLTPSGIRQMIQRRCREAGIPEIHPHQFRHTFAHIFLSQGGQETNLMQLAGWSSRKMVEKYAASARAERARDEHRRLSPGELI